MESVHVLLEQQHLLAVEYGADEPRPVEGEDLESADIADAEHWVDVYSGLVDFTCGLLESGPRASGDADDPAPGRSPDDLRPLMLQAQVQELHLTFWVNRLNRLRTQSGSGEDRPD